MLLFTLLLLLVLLVSLIRADLVKRGNTCYLRPSNGDDDSDLIINAFEQCGQNGKIEFAEGGVFQVGKVMNTTGLSNCIIDFNSAKLVFSTDTDYWLANSINVDFQDQSTAWLLGGRNLIIKGGEIDGNGQTWYDQNRGRSNQPGRPISLTIFESQHVLIDGLIFTQPQFWAAFISYSSDIIMRNIKVSAVSTSQWKTVNTDGADTWNSDRILLENWDVISGDDCIAAKGNTTNLHIRNITCRGGNGMTIGSVGQYRKTPDYVDNVLFEDVEIIDAFNAAFIKTWQGVPSDDSTNGDAGGGGKGYVRNIVFRNFTLTKVALPIQITQCIYTENKGDECETSKMAISNITWKDFRGTTTYNIAASLHCASGHPCPGIVFDNINLQSVNKTLGLPNYGVRNQDEVFQCSNLIKPEGVKCNKKAPADFSQIVGDNIS
jgi:galacturan 1,4-alpha-galacturonidase